MLMPTPVVSCVLSMHWHPPWLEWEMCLSQWHAECCYHQCYACGLMRRNIKIKQLCIADIICFNKGGLLLGHFFYLGFIYIYTYILFFVFAFPAFSFAYAFILRLLLLLLFFFGFFAFAFAAFTFAFAFAASAAFCAFSVFLLLCCICLTFCFYIYFAVVAA